jgi:hypothetical protein
MGHRIAVCTAVLLLASMPSRGAEFFYMDHDPFTDAYVGPIGPLVMSGEIVTGDYERLLKKITGDEGRFLAENQLLLASDGGDVAEAIRIATLLKSLHTKVVVARLTGRCVSACFFIYAAAEQREADGERLLGINRPFMDGSQSSPGEDSTPGQGAVFKAVRAFLHDNAVPDYLADEMFRHPSDDAYWLSAEDEKNLGHRSAALSRYLAAKCAYDEREALAGKESNEALKQKLKCRNAVISADAHKALLQARAEST